MPKMDYEALEKAIMPKTKAIITVDLSGTVYNYAKVFENIEKQRNLFISVESDGSPLGGLSSRIQKAIGRIAAVADCTHSLGASRIVSHTEAGNIEMGRQ